MDFLYLDEDIAVCVKPARVLSTDEPGGLPELVRDALGDPKADVRTVHRLDRVVSGLMVLARNGRAASELSHQIREDLFQKEYLAVIHGCPGDPSGTLRDLLFRDKARRMTMVANEPGKGVQEAILDYQVLNRRVSNLIGRGVVLKKGQTLKDLYEERVPLYEKYADYIIDEKKTDAEGTLQKILEIIK